ncbi:30S ribosomal protein S8 [Desulfosarcina sp. OttesenSCG-928-A07]|nr:30S ribosomal protein S8 [Desulfosarcina sp. OttesenSCG-928-G17]MDL2329208.1 30S ribosomal protein S8 [Desulfosarcina sp. OttesenSCG-928-A07]
MSDPIADMLTRIRNAGKAKHNSVDIPGSRIKTEIARILKESGYIRNYKVIADNKQGILRVYLKYTSDQKHTIFKIQRVSKPSLRRYCLAKAVTPVYNGLGIAILSTSQGVMTDKLAREKNIGGEILCTVW